MLPRLHVPARLLGDESTLRRLATLREAGPALRVSTGVHSVAELLLAVDVLGDALEFCFASPWALTPSKPGYGPALGPEGLRELIELAPCPVVALGGVLPGHVAQLAELGCAAVAVMGPLAGVDGPARARAYVAAIGGASWSVAAPPLCASASL